MFKGISQYGGWTGRDGVNFEKQNVQLKLILKAPVSRVKWRDKQNDTELLYENVFCVCNDAPWTASH